MSLTVIKNKFSPNATAERMDSQHRALLAGIEPYYSALNAKSLMDSNEGWTLLRQLTVFSEGIFQKRFPEVKYAQAYNVRTGAGGRVPPGAEAGLRRWGWHSEEDIGKFKTVANSTDDLPSLSQDMKEHLVDLRLAGAHFKIGWEDAMAAACHNMPIQTDLGAGSRRAAERYHDTIGATGDSDFGLKGLLADFTSMSDYGAAPGTDWIASNWSGATDAAKLAALSGLVTYVSQSSGEVFGAAKISMPNKYLTDIMRPNLITGTTYTSVYNVLMESYGRFGLTITSWERMKEIDFSGTPYDVIMAYPLEDEVGEHRIIIPYMMKAPMLDVHQNLCVATYAKTAGVLKRQPKAHVFGKTNWT